MGTERARRDILPAADPAAFLEANLPTVELVAADVARRHRVRGDALLEFRSLAFLKLVEHDYSVLRRFQGASSLRTYLTVVLQRVLLDHRNREWGRWRPSAAAHRMGPVAVRLDRLVTRDGLTPAEALATVGPDADLTGCTDFVARLRDRGSVRGSRTTLGEGAIPECPDPAPGPDAAREQHERLTQADRVRRVVRRALHSLDSQDHLIVTLRFRDGLSVADIARLLELDAKPLYRRIDRILVRLHSLLSREGAQAELARTLAREPWDDHAPESESGWWRSSTHLSGPASAPRSPVA